MKKIFCSWLGALVLVGAAGAARAQNGPTDPYGGMDGRIFDAGGGFTMPYRLGKPTPYDAAKKYPLVVFLHGSGESGTDNRLQISKNIGTTTPGSVFTTTANEAKFPTFFIAPQTPSATIGWASGSKPLVAVLKLITALEAEFSIDPKRLYLTGLSLGGMGTWTLIQENPDLFAAAIPMSGRGDPTMAAKLIKIPIWDFHGAKDPSVDVAGSRDMIAAIMTAGGHPRYTEYPNGMHDIWFQAYTTPELLPWMNMQTLGSLDPTVDGGAGGPKDAGADAPAAADAGGGAGTGASAGAGGGAGATGAAGTNGGAAGTSVGGAGAGAAGTTGQAGTVGAAGTNGGAAGTTGSGAGGTKSAGTTGGSSGCAIAGTSDRSSGALVTFAAIFAVIMALGGRRRRRT